MMDKDIELKHGEKVFYQSCHKEYGIARFTICQKYKYGKLTDLFISPSMQTGLKQNYHVTVDTRSKELQIGGIDNPGAHGFAWCKNHKTFIFEINVPRDSNYFTVELLSITWIKFYKEN